VEEIKDGEYRHEGDASSAKEIENEVFDAERKAHMPYKEEETHTITFNSSTSCVHYKKGYDYIWDYGYKKNWWDATHYCTYTVSGSTITIYEYEGSGSGSESFTYTGSSLICGDKVFK